MSITSWLLCLVALFAQTPTLKPDPPIQCDDCAAWNQPRAPFKIYGNTYYVGVAGLSSVLIVSNAGLVLIDGALPQSVPSIDGNVRALGFKTADIKLILNGHTHYDHAGGLSALQRFTGAPVATGAAGVPALEQGRPTADDPQVGFANNGFPPVHNVRGVRDGEVLTVGDVAITAHATPGHTPGGTTWTWRACEGSRCLDLVYADSLTPVSAPGFRFTGDATHASRVDSFRRSITRVGELPCDIMIAAHPSIGRLDEKLKRRAEQPNGPNAFIEPSACRTLASDAIKALDARVAQERSIATTFDAQRTPNVVGRVDHLIYAAPDLQAGVDAVERLLGVRATPGGSHPGRGTRNALVALGPARYLEIIAPDPAQPNPSGGRPFRIDTLSAPALVTWALKATNLDAEAADALRQHVGLGPVMEGSRNRPDGVLLRWRYTDSRVEVADGVVPFIIDWGSTPHPAQTASRGATLVSLRAEHPDAAHVARMLRAIGVDLPITQAPRPALIATIDSPKGRVELR